MLDDVRANRYAVIGPQTGVLFHAIVRKGDRIYLGADRIATGNDSFWYLGNGYDQLNGQIYFLGEHVGAYPLNGTVVVHIEDRTRQRPGDYPQGRLFCVVKRHASILETSTGLRIERIVDDN